MDEQLHFEYLMLNAFGLRSRKEISFADADFFDLEDVSSISGQACAVRLFYIEN